jgi:hypothetical protein
MNKQLFFLLVLCCVAIVPAQERIIDQAEFESVVKEGSKHNVRWKGEKYRMTVTTSSKVAGRPQTDYSAKMIFEYGAEKQFRTRATSVFGDKPGVSRETLLLDEILYSRSGDEPWTRKDHVPAEQPAERNETAPPAVVTNTEYRYLGTEQLMNRTTNVYLKSERQTRTDKTTGRSTESDVKVKYWVGSDGTVLKSEYASTNRGAAFTGQTLIVTEWELDPSITFTPPEIASK